MQCLGCAGNALVNLKDGGNGTGMIVVPIAWGLVSTNL